MVKQKAKQMKFTLVQSKSIFFLLFLLCFSLLLHPSVSIPVSAIDFSVDGVVGISGGQDAIVSIGQYGGQGNETGSLWPVEHLRFELGKFVLQVGELFGQSFDNAGVNASHDAVFWGPQIL